MDYTMTAQGVEHSEAHTVSIECSSGVTALVRALVAVGMAHRSDLPDFPESDHLDGSDYVDERPVSARARAYEAGRQLVLADHGSHGAESLRGIPSHKLSSGDGWHVTARECREAHQGWIRGLRMGAAAAEAIDDAFIAVLIDGACWDGFRVN